MSNADIAVREEDTILTVEFSKEANLDFESVEVVRPKLFELVESGPGQKVILDFSNVAFMSSMAIGALLTLRLKAARTDTRLIIAGMRAALVDLLRVTHLNELFELVPSREAALERLRTA